MANLAHRLRLPLALLIVLSLGVILYRTWAGPVIPAYRVEIRPLVQTVVATGRIIGTSRIQVGSEITGVVVDRRVIEGDIVAPGDVLITLRADDLSALAREAEAELNELQSARRPQAEAALRQAEAQLQQASREAERRRELLEDRLVSRESAEQAAQVEVNARAAAEQARLLAGSLAPGQSEERVLRERLAAAEAALAKTIIKAEVAGTVLTRNVEPGDLVQPGRVLLEIARQGDTEILVPFDEKNLAMLAIDQQAQCLADAYPDRPFPAGINFISPTVDPQRGTVDVRLKVDPVPEYLRQDMTVSVTVLTARRDGALVLPNDAFLEIAGDRAAVFAVRNGRAERTEVQLGLRGTAMTEVVTGLRSGDTVLADPNVAPGSRVRVAPMALPAAGDGSATRQEVPVRFD